MTKSNYPDGRLAELLRSQGFIPLPRLWVKSDAMEEVKAIADRYAEEVNEMRAKVRRDAEIDALWAAR